MTIHRDFELLKTQNIPELNTEAGLYRHIETGAQVLSLINEEDNKVFGITFRTPPKNSTGVAHILEHSVLCGSRKYPVKEPFVELLKGSLKTFLNAFTYPDKTCYPVASTNTQDFYNLIDVYLDAVFYPLITRHIFQQEAWHLDMEDASGPITYKGVVYNEMKGAYSSPDSLLAEYSQRSLFPDNTYGFDSGGEPSSIPTLTYEEFLEFHRRYYHPSNARIYFYGNDDPDRRLDILSTFLNDFTRMEIDSGIPLQGPFPSPRRVMRAFAASDSEGKPKGMMTVNWLLPELSSPELNLSLQVLQYVLLGMPGSPLRKALIDSGLGDDIAGTGLEKELRQGYFSTGLKGIAPENADRIESLIIETLESLAREGVDVETIEAALNTVEFRLRENNSGAYPRGLVLMLRSLSTWLHDGDPLALLAFDAPLSRVKSRFLTDRSYFRQMIEKCFLQNTHRTSVILTPDPTLADREREEENERIEVLRRELTLEDIERIVRDTAELRRRQETPDPPEALARIPALKIPDLDRRNKTIPLSVAELNGARILYHDLFTNGILYLDMGFDLHQLPQEMIPYAPLFGRALVEMGTSDEDFVSLTKRISRKTGGIKPDLFTSSVAHGKQGAAWLILRGKSMLPQFRDMLRVITDVLLTVRLDNRDRFRQMVMEEKVRHEHRLVPHGHQIINLRLRSHFNEADWAREQMSGVGYLFFLRALAREVDENWPTVLSTLERMRTILVNRCSMIFNVTLDETNWKECTGAFEEFIDALPFEASSGTAWQTDHSAEHEGLIVPSQVNYVGKGADLYELGYRFHGSIQVITGYLRSSWLWDRIRVQGGAYGAMCLFDRLSGVLTFVSYRDPNLIRTLDNFDLAAEFLRNIELPDRELTKAVIGAISVIDSYLLPDTKGYVSMLRHLTGDTEEARQSMREEVLSTSEREFRAFADVLEQVRHRGLVKVLGSRDAIEAANAGKSRWLQPIRLL